MEKYIVPAVICVVVIFVIYVRHYQTSMKTGVVTSIRLTTKGNGHEPVTAIEITNYKTNKKYYICVSQDISDINLWDNIVFWMTWHDEMVSTSYTKQLDAHNRTVLVEERTYYYGLRMYHVLPKVLLERELGE